MKTQKSFKTVGIVIALAALLGIVLFAIGQKDYGDLRMRSEQAVDAMNKEYAEDTYGGATPEETLQLFTDALKKGDTELASKYFLPEDRGEMKVFLDQLKARDGMKKLFEDMGLLKKTYSENNKVFFSIANNEGIVDVQVVLIQNEKGLWKILQI